MSDAAAIIPTDFLRHIVEKSLGAEGTITPRLPSLFESGPGAPVVAPAEDAQQEAPQVDAPPAVPTPSRVPAARVVPMPFADAASVAEAGALLRQAESTRAVPAHQANSVRVPAPASERHERAPNLPAEPRGATAIEPASEPGKVSDAAARPAAPAKAGVLSAPAAQLARPPEATQTTPESRPRAGRAERADPVAVPATQPQAQQPTVRGSLRPSPLAAPMPPAQPPSALRGERQAQVAAQQQEPVINVTIGRVEVRAVQGAVSRPRGEAVKNRPLSLDDYLKRNEVRR